MKKVFFTVLFAGMTAVYAQAQLFMGAQVNLKAEQVNMDDGTKRRSETSIGVYADIGYGLSEKWDIGAHYGGSIGMITNHITDTETTSAHWLLSPYVRYTIAQAGKFKLLGKGSVTTEGSKTDFRFSIDVVPVVAYHMSDRIALQASLNFFNLGMTYKKDKDADARTTINLAGNSDNVATLGNIKVGFVYKF